MIELYTWGTPNGHKASVMLEEIGMPYNVHAVNLAKNEQKTRSFLPSTLTGASPRSLIPKDLAASRLRFSNQVQS